MPVKERVAKIQMIKNGVTRGAEAAIGHPVVDAQFGARERQCDAPMQFQAHAEHAGLADQPLADDVAAVRVHTVAQETGSFRRDTAM